MAIHSATDTYAHSVRYNSEYLRHVKGDNGINIADDPYTCHWRYEDAQQVARKIMSKYTKSGSVTTSDLLPDKVPTEYKLYNLYTYVKEEEGQSMAADVLSYSYQNSTK